MDIQTIYKYLHHTVLLDLNNGFRYKIKLTEDIIVGDTLSFIGKKGEPVDFKISEIAFITISKEDSQ